MQDEALYVQEGLIVQSLTRYKITIATAFALAALSGIVLFVVLKNNQGFQENPIPGSAMTATREIFRSTPLVTDTPKVISQAPKTTNIPDVDDEVAPLPTSSPDSLTPKISELKTEQESRPAETLKYGHVLGYHDAPVIVIEFGDFL